MFECFSTYIEYYFRLDFTLNFFSVPAPVTSSNSQSNLLDDLYMSSDDSD